MEADAVLTYSLWKQSSLAPEKEFVYIDHHLEDECEDASLSDVDPGLQLMYLVNEGDLEGIKELLDDGTDVNFRDIDHRTAVHVTACQGYLDVANLLLEKGAKVDPKDPWGSTWPIKTVSLNKDDGGICLFRPQENVVRMQSGARRMCMPSPSVAQFVKAVKQITLANKHWIPPPGKGSLYIRPL